MAGKPTRRGVLRSGAAVGLAGGILSASGSARQDERVQNSDTTQDRAGSSLSWPMYQYNAQHRAAPATTGPTDGVETVWTFGTGGSVEAQPIVADGKVFVASTDSRVYALAARTGDEQWSVATNGKLTETPAVADGIVYVPTNTKRVLALSAGTGSGQWATKVATEGPSSVTLIDGDPFVSYGDYPGGMARLDAATGEAEWTVTFGDDRHSGLPLYADGMVYIVDRSYTYNHFTHRVKAFDITTEELRWKVSRQAVSHEFGASLGDGTVYLGRPGHIFAFDAATGEERWKFTNISKAGQAPVYADGRLYATSQNGGIHAIDPAIGTRQWRVSIDGVPTEPVVVDGTVYVGSTDNNVYAFDAVDGEKLWTFSTGNAVFAPPTVLDGTVYVASTDNTVYALRERGKISPGDVTGDGNQARDLDGDGLYEDVNGDGAFTIVDVQALFANLDSDIVQGNPKFDFNGDGQVDVTDVQALYARLRE